MKLVVSRRAARRLREISEYLHDHNAAAAINVQHALHQAFSLIAQHPKIGRQVRPDVRRFALPRFPYLIYYTDAEESGEVIIITVLHAARKPNL